jgi:alkaline phosphatase D
VGVEVLPTSISRGNFDETLAIAPPNPVYDTLVNDTLGRNPHHRYLELTSHGFGVVDVTAERMTAEIWYMDILERTDVARLGVSLSAQRGANKWDR